MKKSIHAKRYSFEEKNRIIRCVLNFNKKYKRGGIVYAKHKYGVYPITLNTWLRDYKEMPYHTVDSLSPETTETLNAGFKLIEKLTQNKAQTNFLILKEKNTIRKILNALAYKITPDVSAKMIAVSRNTLTILQESFKRLDGLNQKHSLTSHEIQREKYMIRLIIDKLRYKSRTVYQ